MTLRLNMKCTKIKDYSYPRDVKLETVLFMLLFEIRLNMFDQKKEAQLT